MLIQRDLPVHVWGRAAPGQQVSVTFRDETRVVATNPLGHWDAHLKPGAAGGPFEMTVKAADGNTSPATVIHDILVGDLWVASGQSNMEFEMRKASTAAADLPNANHPRIRLLIVKKRAADYAQENVETDGWAASTPGWRRNFPRPGTSAAKSSRRSTSRWG